jgi:hypothetical protein
MQLDSNNFDAIFISKTCSSPWSWTNVLLSSFHTPDFDLPAKPCLTEHTTNWKQSYNRKRVTSSSSQFQLILLLQNNETLPLDGQFRVLNTNCSNTSGLESQKSEVIRYTQQLVHKRG